MQNLIKRQLTAYCSYLFKAASCLLLVVSLLGCGGMNVSNSTNPPSPVPSTYTIFGSISGATQEGVTLTLSGSGSKTAVSGSSGSYSFPTLSNGTYTIIPSLSGYTFSPVSLTATIEGADISGKDFTSSATSESNGWTQVTSGITTQLSGVKFVSSTTGFAVGENGIILKTTDGGSSWTKVKEISGVYFNDIDEASINTLFAVGNGGIIYSSSDSGATWIAGPSGTSNLFGVHFSGTTGWAVGSNGTILKIQLGGNWTTLSSGTTKTLYDVKFIDANIGYVVGELGTIRKTTDGGNNWTATTGDVGNATVNSIFLLDSNSAITVGNEGTIHESTDGGSSWGSQSDPTVTTSTLWDIYSISSDVKWIVGDNGTILKYITQDGPRRWEKQTNPAGSSVNLKALTFYGLTGWAVGSGGTILKYTE